MRRGWPIFLLFGVVFGGVGIGMTIYSYHVVDLGKRAATWARVPARITHVELKTHRGDDSDTYSVVARYEYDVAGTRYSGDRVGLIGGSDSSYSFHNRRYAELSSYMNSGEPFDCRVDPDDPAKAVLYPEMRWGMMMFLLVFATVFGAVGVGMFSALFLKGSGSGVIRRLKKASPDKPWLWCRDWAEGKIRGSGGGAAWVSLAVAVYWNAVSLPIVVKTLAAELPKGNYVMLAALAYPAVGLGAFGVFWYSYMKLKKYGVSVFELASVPGVLGGRLAGVIYVPVHVQPEAGFHVRLRCVNRVTTGSGKQRSTHENTAWEAERVIRTELLERDFTRTAMPVLFGLPYDGRPSTTASSDNEIIWRLEAKAATPGLDYSAMFVVPVFRTGESSPDFVLDESSIRKYE